MKKLFNDYIDNDMYFGGNIMKIVLNKDFGDFRINYEAVMEIAKRKNIL